MSNKRTLYKRGNDGHLCYRTIVSYADMLSEYCGKVGELGIVHQTRLRESATAERAMADALGSASEAGFAPIDLNAHARLLIEHALNRDITTEDIDDRILLERRIYDLLNWTGLGTTSGGETWPNSYEVFCFVVDFETTKRVIAENLASTKYAQARIYEQDPSLFGPIRPLPRSVLRFARKG